MLIDDRCIKRIHVNMHEIRQGKPHPISVKHKGKTYKAWSVTINGPAHATYSPDKPLPCGARVWIETRASVDVFV